MKIKLSRISQAGDGLLRYMVVANEKTVGFISKYRDTRTETHPWKAFAARQVSPSSPLLSTDGFQTFYGPDAKKQAISFLTARVR